jgi:SAM-dependent methyltransferase
MSGAIPVPRIRDLRLRPFHCPGCGPSLLLRLGDDEMQVRCLRCRGTPVHLSLVAALTTCVGPLAGFDACELSTTGALLRYLQRHCRSVSTSEYLEGVAPGSSRDGIRCEDVQHLSHADGSFDLCTSTEVFEHVPDDRAGLRELHRVLRPGGHLLFTVPLSDRAGTVERARRDGRHVEYLLPPAFHGDRLNGPGSVLVYRDYGRDIVDRVRASGFEDVVLWTPRRDFHGHRRTVVVAHRD